MKKIVILGPESTGKSTLTTQLSSYFKVASVPEYAREYLNALNRQYRYDDLLEIARGQLRNEAKIVENHPDNKVVFLDTDLTVIKLWSCLKFGECHPWIEEQIVKHSYDHYLLTYPDLDWTEDQLRENPEDRHEIFRMYETEMLERKLPFTIIKGLGDDRFQRALDIVDSVLR